MCEMTWKPPKIPSNPPEAFVCYAYFCSLLLVDLPRTGI